MNYYNENDPRTAEWLSELIYRKQIPQGHIDTRSINEVLPSDLNGFTQVHLFAGIGGWSYALELANWHEDKPVWTGSCPCQPFSAAGKNKGNSDERHLWPEMHRLIRECKPDTIFGEQVTGAIKHGWLDDIQTDLEGEGYAVGHCVLGAHSVGSPHIRQRLYWVANSGCNISGGQDTGINDEANSGEIENRQNIAQSGEPSRAGQYVCGMADAEHEQHQRVLSGHRKKYTTVEDSTDKLTRPGAADWLKCADGKQRPVKRGIFPLANGLPRGMVHSSNSDISPNETQEARVMRLKGYGNAIVPQVAAEFIKAYIKTEI